ncbi:MAG: hypothetical protein FJY67_02910 [Calditrichaeota bacterium]|nr:hypothetical protein [Calditrichota bacterium]
MGLWARITLPIVVSLLGLFTSSLALERSGTASPGGETWRRSDSPVIVTGLFRVERESRLDIEPGVTVRFAAGAGLMVEGDLVARGVSGDSIRFTGEPGGGDWSGISIRGQGDEPAWDESGQYRSRGSVLEYCIIEQAGVKGLEFGAPLEMISVSPLVAHSSVRKCRAVNGTIRVVQNARPMIRDCRIAGNRAARGGGLMSSLGALPVLRNNVFTGNRADDNGGALYISLADAEITRNYIHNNSAGSSGGALYAVRSADLKIASNTFAGNSAVERASTIIFTEQVNAELTGNAFESPGDAIYLEKALLDIKASRNWWGAPPGRFKFTDIIRDRNADAGEPFVHTDPPLYAPPDILPTNPLAVRSIILCRSDAYDREIPVGVADGAPLRIRLEGDDADPEMRNIIGLAITSTHDPLGIVVPLYETAAASGVYTGRADMALKSSQQTYVIGDRDGGEVVLQALGAPDVRKFYPTITPKPMVSDFAIAGSSDLMHLTDHRPRFTWNYFEVVERPQKSFRIELRNGRGEPAGSSGEIRAKDQQFVSNFALDDGETYTATLTAFSGKFWSEPVELAFRMNSLPTAPAVLAPTEDAVLPTDQPALEAVASRDRESDPLTYRMEVAGLSGAMLLPSPALEAKDDLVRWTPAALAENGAFRFRARAVDPFEEGPWSEWRNFAVNTREEPPAPFALQSPAREATIFDLSPSFRWEAASDPDPQAIVTYRLEVSRSPSFTDAVAYEGSNSATFDLPVELANEADFYWRVRAIDNTGLSTESDAARFRIVTTPSVPVLTAPLAGTDERKPGATLTWKAAVDPDPSDRLVYDVRIYANEGFTEVKAQFDDCQATSLALEQLPGIDALADNTVFYWAVRARDNHAAASAFSRGGSFFFNKVNDPPSKPALTGPTEELVKSVKVSFSWTASSDPDLSDSPSSLVYELQATPSGFDDPEMRTVSSPAGATSLVPTLADNTLWRYRLRSRDDDGAVSDWTAVGQVLVNVAEDPPTAFTLLSPPDRAEIATLDEVSLTWKPATDPDYGSSVRYRVELLGPLGKTYRHETVTTEWTFTEGLENESTYRWKVIAIDNTGLETTARSEFTFAANSTPSLPRPVTPSGTTLDRDGELTWSASKDPDPRDVVTYILQIAADGKFTSPLLSAAGLGSQRVALTALAGHENLRENEPHFWRVRANDQRGCASAWSPSGEIVVNLRNDPPVPFRITFPVEGDTLPGTELKIRWEASRDPDPGAKVTYTVGLAGDEEFAEVLFQMRRLDGTSYNVPPGMLEPGKTYYLRLSADDGEGGVTYGSATDSRPLRFTMKPAPTAVSSGGDR